MRRLVAWSWDHPGLAVALLALLSALAAVGAVRVGVDNAVEIWFVDGDPTLEAWRDFQERFGNDEVAVVAFHDPAGMIRPEGFALLQRAEVLAREVNGIADAVSLASADAIRAGEDWIELGPPRPEVEGWEPLRERLVHDPLLVGRLVNRDGTLATVLVRMEAMDDIDARRDAILAELRTRLDTLGVPVRMAGIGVIYAALNRASTVDSAVFIAASYALILLLLGVLFRRPGPVAVTVGVVAVATLWMMGMQGFAGRDINLVTMVLPTLITIIGVSDCVHILLHVARQPEDPGVAPAERRRARVVDGVAFMAWPCLFNTLTTAAGFAALSTAPMQVVRDLGVFAAAGLLGAFLVALVGCTVALRWRWAEPATLDHGLLARGARGLVALALRRPGTVVVVTGLACLVAALGVSRIVVDTYSIDFLHADHPVRRDSDFIEAHLGPYTPLEMLVEIDPDRLRIGDPELLSAIARWEDRAVGDPAVGWANSLADLVRRLEQALSGDDPAAYRVPTRPDRLAQNLLLLESSPDLDLDALRVEPDLLRVTFGIRMQSARGIGDTIERVRRAADLPPGATLRPAGYLPLYVRMMDYIVRSQVTSFGTAFLVIFLLIGLLFRSVRSAALAIPSNLLPVLAVLGVMGLAGIRLDVATVTIAAIVLGLVVDDTVQFLYRLRHELRQGFAHGVACRRAVDTVGRAMAITSVVMALGFSVLGLAEVKSVAWFGLLIALALVAALVADLLVLPALVVLLRPPADSDHEGAVVDVEGLPGGAPRVG